MRENEFLTLNATEPVGEQCSTVQSPCVGVLTVCQADKATIGSKTKLASQNETTLSLTNVTDKLETLNLASIQNNESLNTNEN